MVKKKDYIMHQTVYRCNEKTQKKRRVRSARQLSANLRSHQMQLKLERHASEQTQRNIVRDFQQQQRELVTRHWRVQSAYPVLVGTVAEARMSSAVNQSAVSRYSRNLMSAIDSCRGCTTKFTPATRLPIRESYGGVSYSDSTLHK